TLSDGADPVRRSEVTPLSCVFQVLPASVERSIFPAAPTRQPCLLSGAEMKPPPSTCNIEKLPPLTGSAAALTSTLSVIELTAGASLLCFALVVPLFSPRWQAGSPPDRWPDWQPDSGPDSRSEPRSDSAFDSAFDSASDSPPAVPRRGRRRP